MIQRKRLVVILSVGFILSVPSIIYLSAWSGPTATPPSANVGPLIGGSGATAYMPRFTGALTLGNSSLTSDGLSSTAIGNFFVSGGRLFYGNAFTRTETRDDAGIPGGQSGFYESSAPSPASSWYPGASSWQHLLEVRHSNTSNNYALQIAGSFFDQNLYFRKTNDNASTAWSKVVSADPSTGNVAITGGITGNFTLLPGYKNWAVDGTGAGGAAVYNDNGTYKKLMILGNNSAGGVREVGIWDNLTVNGNTTVAGTLTVSSSGIKFNDGTTLTTATGGIGGSGTTGYVPRYTAASTLSNSSITSDGVSSTANGNFFTTGILQSTNGFRGDAAANFGGTGAAAYFPNGLWSNGANAWIYGQINTNGIISDTSARMALNPAGNSFFNGGNVGIGTQSPGAKLEVSGNGTFGSEDGPIMATNSSVPGKKVSIGYDNSIDAGYISALHSGVTWKNLVLQGAGGNVGIGTTNPGAKLEVNGSTIMGGGSSSNWATLNLGGGNSINAGGAIYSYAAVCVGMNNGNCSGAGGTRINGIGVTFPDGTTQTTASAGGGNTTSAGTAGYIPLFTGPNTIQNSMIAADASQATVNGNFTVTGNEGVKGGLTVGGFGVTNNTDGSLSIGHQGINYTPTGSNWTTSGSTLLLSGQDYTTIGFHDSGLRVDYIRAGAGTIQLGYNAGWGEANIGMPGGGVWNNSGNVGIGTNAPGAKLDVAGGDLYVRASGRVITDTLQNYSGGGVPLNIQTGGAQNLTFGTNGTERMRIDTSGNVGIGAPSAGAKLDVNGGIKLNGSLAGSSSITQSSGGATTSLTPGSLALVSQYGAIMTIGGGRLDMSDGGSISSYYNWNGLHTGGVTNASNYADAGDGQFIALNYNSNGKAVYGAGYGAQGYGIYCAVGYCGSAGASWTTTSDGRLKENIKTIASGLDKILNLRGVYYTWKDHRMTGNQIGFIAQEVLPIVPEAVTKNANGEYTMSYERIVPVLVEAVKDLNKKNDDLKAQNDKLEARLSALEAKLK